MSLHRVMEDYPVTLKNPRIRREKQWVTMNLWETAPGIDREKLAAEILNAAFDQGFDAAVVNGVSYTPVAALARGHWVNLRQL